MVQVVKQTDEQKLKMYMKLPKREIATMLVNCNNCLDARPLIVKTFTGKK